MFSRVDCFDCKTPRGIFSKNAAKIEPIQTVMESERKKCIESRKNQFDKSRKEKRALKAEENRSRREKVSILYEVQRRKHSN